MKTEYISQKMCCMIMSKEGEITRKAEQSKAIIIICSTHRSSIARILFWFLTVPDCHISQNTKDFEQISLSQPLRCLKILCCFKHWLSIWHLSAQHACYLNKWGIVRCFHWNSGSDIIRKTTKPQKKKETNHIT